MAQSAKYRNIQQDQRVALVVDDDPGRGPAGMRFLEIRGTAETATGEAPWAGLPPEIIAGERLLRHAARRHQLPRRGRHSARGRWADLTGCAAG